jgi:hypothetical protein
MKGPSVARTGALSLSRGLARRPCQEVLAASERYRRCRRRTNSTGIGQLRALLATLGRTVICRPAEQRAAPEVRGDRPARRHVPPGPAPGTSRAVPSGPPSGRSRRRGFTGEVHAALCAALCQLAVTRERLDRPQRDRARLEAAEQATAWKRNRPAARGPAAGRSSRPIADANGYHLCPDPLAARESAEFMGTLHFLQTRLNNPPYAALSSFLALAWACGWPAWAAASRSDSALISAPSRTARPVR